MLEDAEAPQRSAVEELARDDSSRKKFLKMGGSGVAASLSLLIAACGSSKKSSTSSSSSAPAPSSTGSSSSSGSSGDLGIVNYALTLEYLETDFYKKVAASGLFKGKNLAVIKQFGEEEAAHVEALKGAAKKLGGQPAAQPKTKFPLKSASSVLKLAQTVEDLGAAAYLGQAGKIKSKEILAAALSIHTIEARHAAALNMLLGKSVTPDGAFAKPAEMSKVLAAAKPFIVS
jgi:rubrerythrin